MNILVTGGSGFIGSALIRHILTKTDHNVVNVDNLTYAANQSSVLLANHFKSRYRFEKVDICDKKEILRVFETHQPDYVMNLAAESHVDNSILDPSQFVATNINGTFNLLENARSYFDKLDPENKKSFRFLHVSTDEVFGDLDGTKEKFTEITRYNPSSPYSASKAASDHLVKAWWRTYELPILLTNCSNNYGPYQFREKLIPHMIFNALKGEPLPIYGDGLQIRDWLYVDDHVDALMHILKFGVIGETYNIGGNNEKTNFEVVNIICDNLELSLIKKPKNTKYFRDLIKHVEDRPGHDLRYAIDASKLEQDLEWKPNETFDTGIIKTIDWYITNKDWLVE